MPAALVIDDGVWAKWHGSGVAHVVAIADLRGDDFKGLGRLDTRRADIDLKDKFVDKTVVVEIQDKAVKIITLKK